MVDVRFRPCAPGDLPGLATMVLALYGEDGYAGAMTAEQVRRTADELARRPHKGRIVLAEAGGAVAGYAILVWFWSNEHGGTVAILDELYVEPAWRGRGVGAAFLAHLAAAPDADGGPVRGMLLEVAPANARARDFYLRHGFAPAANRHLFRAAGPRGPGGPA